MHKLKLNENIKFLKVHYFLITPTTLLLTNEISVTESVLVLVFVRQELDVREGEEANFTSQLALPLPVDVHLRHLDDVANFELQSCLVVCIWYAGLFDASERG
jgi:hypothetical protein